MTDLDQRTGLNQAQRTMRAQIAANMRWSNPQARAEQVDKRLLWFASQVDPHGMLPEVERMKLARQRRRAYMQQLALTSSKARAARRDGAHGG